MTGFSQYLPNLSERDINILMGDRNAKVGSDNTGYEEFMGKYSLGAMKDNGERFGNLCATNYFVMCGTFFTL